VRPELILVFWTPALLLALDSPRGWGRAVALSLLGGIMVATWLLLVATS
jgi:hypothetical protein